MRITEDETNILIKESTANKSVELGFDPSGAWIKATQDNVWAFKRINELRAEKADVKDGVELNIPAGAQWLKCPKCGYTMTQSNPPKYYKPDGTEDARYIVDNRPSCPHCGVKFNVIIFQRED